MAPPPPPLPEKLRRIGIPLVGSLSLMSSVASIGCGRKAQGGEDKEFEGSWNLVQQNYAGYSRSFPYGYSYVYEGQTCGYFLSIDLEVDTLTQGRVVNTYGYVECYGDATQSDTQTVDFEIRGDGKLIVSMTNGGLDETGGGQDDFLECERDGALLACIAPADGITMRFARPECASHDDCSDGAYCLGRQCTTLQSGGGDGPSDVPPSVSDTGAMDSFTETGFDDGFSTSLDSETGP